MVRLSSVICGLDACLIIRRGRGRRGRRAAAARTSRRGSSYLGQQARPPPAAVVAGRHAQEGALLQES